MSWPRGYARLACTAEYAEIKSEIRNRSVMDERKSREKDWRCEEPDISARSKNLGSCLLGRVCGAFPCFPPDSYPSLLDIWLFLVYPVTPLLVVLRWLLKSRSIDLIECVLWC